MNLLVIHGDDINAAYKKFTAVIEDAKNKNWQTLYLNQGSNIKESLSTPSLFSEKRLFVIENIKKIKKTDLIWFSKKSSELPGNLIIYEKGFVPRLILKNLGQKISLMEYKLPKVTFSFLDSLSMNSQQQSLRYLHELGKYQPIEFTFILIAKRFKELYWIKSDPSSLPYQDWRITKLKNQSEQFSKGKLKKIINKLAKIDIESKTSKVNLLDLIELLIIKELS